MNIKLDQETLEIKPEGETETLIFELSGHTCGRAYKGIGFRRKSQLGGGVLTLDDALMLRDWLNERIKEAVTVNKTNA